MKSGATEGVKKTLLTLIGSVRVPLFVAVAVSCGGPTPEVGAAGGECRPDGSCDGALLCAREFESAPIVFDIQSPDRTLKCRECACVFTATVDGNFGPETLDRFCATDASACGEGEGEGE